jgi:hypothetical protein
MRASKDYSKIVVLTGAGASKACGLPDMVDFAQQFKSRVEMKGHDSPAARLVRDIFALDDPDPDLESLMSTLTALSSEGTDAAVNLLLSEATKSEQDLIDALGSTGKGLTDWVDRVPLGDGPFDVVRHGSTPMLTMDPLRLTTPSSVILGTGQQGVSGLRLAPPSGVSQPPTFGGISKTTVETHRKAASGLARFLSVGEDASLRCGPWRLKC